jgi:hypothetical protein
LSEERKEGYQQFESGDISSSVKETEVKFKEEIVESLLSESFSEDKDDPEYMENEKLIGFSAD